MTATYIEAIRATPDEHRSLNDQIILALVAEMDGLVEQFEALRDREADLVDAIKDLLGTPMAGGYEQRDATAAVRSKAARLLAVSNPASETRTTYCRVHGYSGCSCDKVAFPARARYVNGAWEPQCPYGDMCSRCDAIGYCERVASSPASVPKEDA